MTQQLRSIGVVSCAKVLAVLYAILGLLIGAFFSLFFFIGALVGGSSQFLGSGTMRNGALGFVFGVGSIIFFPILYGAIGAISGLIMSALYNAVSKYTGGIEMEIG